MNIKEYIKKQSVECKNEIMKEIFIDLVDTFYPKPVVKVETYNWNPVSKKVDSANDNFYKRKVRINKMPNGKPSIGLIEETTLGIKLPKKERLEFMMIDDQGIEYFYGFNRLFFKTKNSRIVYMVDKNNYETHRANVECIRDYVLTEKEILEID